MQDIRKLDRKYLSGPQEVGSSNIFWRLMSWSEAPLLASVTAPGNISLFTMIMSIRLHSTADLETGDDNSSLLPNTYIVRYPTKCTFTRWFAYTDDIFRHVSLESQSQIYLIIINHKHFSSS